MIKAREIDANGFYVETHIFDNESDLQSVSFQYVLDGWDGQALITPKWDNTNKQWVEGKDAASMLQDAKDAKIAELDSICNQTILAGFDYTINGVSYHFYLNDEAQRNFQGTKQHFADGKITSQRWTVFNNTENKWDRVDLDEPTFELVADLVYNTINSNVIKLRDTLEPQVNACTTIEEVDAITW